MQCIVNAPAEARSAMFARVESARADWKAKAKEVDRDTLATACRQAREALTAGNVCKSSP